MTSPFQQVALDSLTHPFPAGAGGVPLRALLLGFSHVSSPDFSLSELHRNGHQVESSFWQNCLSKLLYELTCETISQPVVRNPVSSPQAPFMVFLKCLNPCRLNCVVLCWLFPVTRDGELTAGHQFHVISLCRRVNRNNFLCLRFISLSKITLVSLTPFHILNWYFSCHLHGALLPLSRVNRVLAQGT